jgi:hypothetical protein
MFLGNTSDQMFVSDCHAASNTPDLFQPLKLGGAEAN